MRHRVSPTLARLLHAPSRQGFSFVEILIVVGILFLLAGLSAGVYAYAREAARAQATTTAMGYLLNANLRYQQAVPIALADTDGAKHFVDLASNGTKNRAMTPMEYFILKTSENPDCNNQLERLPKDMFVTAQKAPVQIWDAAGNLVKSGYLLRTVKDPWGTELKYRSYSDAVRLNASGPPGEQDPAMAYWDFAYFASAGPDAQWGILAAHDPNRPDSQAKNNLYSFTAHQ